MRSISEIGLAEVQGVYSGAEFRLWELIMGQQVHIGGLASSMDLAAKAGLKPGLAGVDLCCCTGAGMRFLVRFQGAARMTGVDATAAVVELGRRRTAEEGLADKIEFVLADVCRSGLPGASADFVWGEDAWCYVVDKPLLIAEAARLVKPGGTIAFTDWVAGRGLESAEAERFLKFMKFPNIFGLTDYQAELKRCGCRVAHAEDTGRFPSHAALYLDMLRMQLTYDGLKLLGFDQQAADWLLGELAFAGELAKAGKLMQGLFTAVRE